MSRFVPVPRSQRGILHFGMRPESRHEVEALRRGNPKSSGGVHRAGGLASGTVDLAATRFDVRTASGVAGLAQALITDGAKPSAARALKRVLSRAGVDSRDDLASFAVAMHRMGKGELPVSRVVLSGHSVGETVYDDLGTHVRYADLVSLAQAFPEGAARVRHVAIAACFSGFSPQLAQMRAAFPNIVSFVGYGTYAPAAERNAPKHLRRWERLTDGDHPRRVDSMGAGSYAWNISDGYRGPRDSLTQLRRTAAYQHRTFDAVRAGRTTASGVRTSLDRYYRTLQRMRFHPDLPKSELPALERHIDDVLYMRHPEMRR